MFDQGEVTAQLRALCEQVAGKIHVDVTFVVSAEAGPTCVATAPTEAAALAAFLAQALEEHGDAETLRERHGDGETSGHDNGHGGEALARPVVKEEAAETAKRKRTPLTEAERERVRELLEQGRWTTDIIRETGLSAASIQRIRTAMREAADPSA